MASPDESMLPLKQEAPDTLLRYEQAWTVGSFSGPNVEMAWPLFEAHVCHACNHLFDRVDHVLVFSDVIIPNFIYFSRSTHHCWVLAYTPFDIVILSLDRFRLNLNELSMHTTKEMVIKFFSKSYALSNCCEFNMQLLYSCRKNNQKYTMKGKFYFPIVPRIIPKVRQYHTLHIDTVVPGSYAWHNRFVHPKASTYLIRKRTLRGLSKTLSKFTSLFSFHRFYFLRFYRPCFRAGKAAAA